MKKLIAYRKSPINNIRIRYNGELVSFNLMSELRIDRTSLNEHLKKQPGYYGFCLLLHKKLMAQFERLKHERMGVYGKLFIYAKEHRTLNSRPYSDETAKSWVESHKKFKEVSERCIKAREDADLMYTCVRSFEQRKDLLQSISSNIRAEQ